mmetsp:Transcript_30231/g.90881  ORF Transcript_30231/g.90881 Transcript_30231/m.90881 type:complete len:212 (+) Transcript_30231:982-1617(+)
MAFLSDDALQDAQAAWRRLDVSLLSGARPWKEFFEVFKPSSGDLEKRMSTNLLHYKTNYAQIALGVVVLGFLAKPSALLGLALAAATACGLLTAPVSRRFIVIGGARIPINNTSRALAATASAIVVLVLFRVLLWLALISCLALLLPLAHMALRPRTLAAKYNAATDEVRSLWGSGTGARDPEDPEAGTVATSASPGGDGLTARRGRGNSM